MKLCFISDTHGRWNKLTIPECDVLISAGDYSFTGEEYMVKDFHKWMSKQPVKHRISVQGNHELQVEKNFEYYKQLAKEVCPDVHFIDEGAVQIDGINFYGSAITPFFCNWAWNRYRGDEIKKHWNRIPDNTDVLITHGPPRKILDLCNVGTVYEEHVGCEDLLRRVKEIKPRIHAFGHIHQRYGVHEEWGIKFINAAICDESYKAAHDPILETL